MNAIVRALGGSVLAAMLVLPVACAQEVQSTPRQSETVSTPSTSPVATTPPPSEPRGLNARTISEAEQTTGYDIYTPSYIPAGFVLGSSIMTGTIGFGEHAQKTVTRIWWLPDDHKTYFSLIQIPFHFEIGGGESAEVNGEPGQRAFLKDPTQPDVPAELTLAWGHQDAFFALTGSIKGPLNEAELLKISASLEHLH